MASARWCDVVKLFTENMPGAPLRTASDVPASVAEANVPAQRPQKHETSQRINCPAVLSILSVPLPFPLISRGGGYFSRGRDNHDFVAFRIRHDKYHSNMFAPTWMVTSPRDLTHYLKPFR